MLVDIGFAQRVAGIAGGDAERIASGGRHQRQGEMRPFIELGPGEAEPRGR